LGARALNLDGLGYAGRVESNHVRQMLLPGHLFYGPIMWAIFKLTALFYQNADAARVMQVADSFAGAIGIGVFISALRRLRVSPFSATCAGLALAFSYTFWVHSTDLTTYAPSTLCLICVFYILCRVKSDSRGVGLYALAPVLALATFIHQSNVLFATAALVGIMLLDIRRRWLHALTFVLIFAVLVTVPYALLGAYATGRRSPVAIARWASGSSHGYKPGIEPMSVPRFAYGFGNSIIYLDDIGTSIKGRMGSIGESRISARRLAVFAAKSAFILALLALPIIGLIRRRARISGWRSWAAWVCVAWILPYTAFALFYFTTDHDRWIMLLPAVWTLFAVAFPEPSRIGHVVLGAVVAAIFALNLAFAIFPSHLGTNNPYYMESRAMAPHLVGSDFVIFWGHDHIGTPGYLRLDRGIKTQHIFDLILRYGKHNGINRLVQMINGAIDDNRRVVIVGLYSPHNRASDYESEAAKLHTDRREVIAALDGFELRPIFKMKGETVYCYTGRRPRPSGTLVSIDEESGK